ncbi:retrovirus-related Pol polyprotein from transposon 412 [Trichonephila clavipes]|nr:retrovirus-related Pol polyprotein from transposon 412 [Trichonephila clavipes]
MFTSSGVSWAYTRITEIRENFSTFARSLHKLTEANKKFIWRADCNNAFNKLKGTLTSPVLEYPENRKQFILDTNASHESIGAVFSQEIDGQERVVAYFSKFLSKPEKKLLCDQEGTAQYSKCRGALPSLPLQSKDPVTNRSCFIDMATEF